MEASDPELLRLATWQLSLAAGAPGRLLRLDRDAAWVALPKLGAVLITSEQAPERLNLQALELLERARGKAHLLVLGGGTELREALTELETSVGSTRLGCLQVDFWGKTWPAPQPELAQLDLKQDPPEVQAFLAASRTAIEQAQQMNAWQERVQGRRPWATWSLCGVFIALWLAELAMGGPELLPIVTRMGGLTRHTLVDGELYRLATASLLHLGWGHIGFAVLVMWQLGGFLERILGPWRFLVLVFVSALGGTLMALPSALSGGLVAGSSTALWGVLVGHVVLAYRPRGLLPDALLPQARTIARNNLVLNALVSLLPGVSLLGHLGGGLAGLALLGPGLLTWGLATSRGERGFRGLAALLVGGFSASLVLALGHGRPWELLEAPRAVTAKGRWRGAGAGRTGAAVGRGAGPRRPHPRPPPAGRAAAQGGGRRGLGRRPRDRRRRPPELVRGRLPRGPLGLRTGRAVGQRRGDQLARGRPDLAGLRRLAGPARALALIPSDSPARAESAERGLDRRALVACREAPDV